MKLNLHQFLPIDVITEIFDILKVQGQSRLVGGCVREILLGAIPKDIDIATQVLPEIVMQLLSAYNYNCIPTGIKYGTITAIKHNYKFEITTLRSDVVTYGRHADVTFTSNFKQDAERRDFTINALYMNLNGEIEDFFDGISHLNKKLLKFIGNAQDRIKEDYLRILRYFRFYSYYNGHNIDMASLSACTALASGIATLSGERIRDEIFKILTAPYARESLILMQRYNVIQEIFPCKHSIDYNSLAFCKDEILNLAAILKFLNIDEATTNLFMNRIKLSRAQKLIISNLLWEISLSLKDPEVKHKEIIYYFGANIYSKYILFLRILYPNEKILSIQNTSLPIFPINGADLLKFGLAGAEIGSKLNQLKKIWIESNFKLTKAKLLKKL